VPWLEGSFAMPKLGKRTTANQAIDLKNEAFLAEA
jgi:hypothetical protein